MPRRGLPSRLLLAVRVLVLSLLTLALFWAAALLLVTLAAWLRGTAPAGAGLLARGAVCGLIAGLFIAVFHLKREVILLRLADRQAFAEHVRAELAELGYVPAVESGDRLVFRPALRSLLFGAAIRVQLGGERATVSGPKVYLEVLRRRLRLHDYVDRASPHPAPARGGRLLRRAELSLRASPEQLDGVRAGLASLRAAGAEVVCQVHVLAWSDAGLPDAAVEDVLRRWQGY